MVKGKIVSLVTLAGEYIGKFMHETNGNITLENPRMLENTPEMLEHYMYDDIEHEIALHWLDQPVDHMCGRLMQGVHCFPQQLRRVLVCLKAVQ